MRTVAGKDTADDVNANGSHDMSDSTRLLEAEKDLLLEKIGRIDLMLQEGAWTGSHGGHDPDFQKLRGGLKRFWQEKAAKDPHPFTYCVRHLRKHVANPERLCFAPGTLIETRDRGLIPIEEIKPGEMVMTHLGRHREVLGTRANRGDGRRMVSISTRLSDLPLVVTEDHDVLVARGVEFYKGTRIRKRGVSARVAAGILEPADRAEDGRYAPQQIGEIVKIKARDVKESDYLLYPRRREVEDRPDVSDDLLWLIGLFAADGCWGSTCPHWTLGIEEPLVKQALACLERETGARCEVDRRRTTDAVRLAPGQPGENSRLRDKLASGITGKAWDKRFADWVLRLPDHRLQIVLDAYWSGDGHIRPDGREAVATTVSHDLAHQLRAMLIYLGHRPRIKQVRDHRTDIIEGREVHGRPTWAVAYNPRLTKSAGLCNEEYIAFPVNGITVSDPIPWTYNLHVSEDNSVIANRVCAFQCAWLKDQALGTTKWRKGNRKIGEAGQLLEWQPSAEELRSALLAYEEAARDLGIIVEGDDGSAGERTPADAGGADGNASADGGDATASGAEAEGQGATAGSGEDGVEAAGPGEHGGE